MPTLRVAALEEDGHGFIGGPGLHLHEVGLGVLTLGAGLCMGDIRSILDQVRSTQCFHTGGPSFKEEWFTRGVWGHVPPPPPPPRKLFYILCSLILISKAIFAVKHLVLVYYSVVTKFTLLETKLQPGHHHKYLAIFKVRTSKPRPLMKVHAQKSSIAKKKMY